MPASMPASNTPEYLIRLTLTPAASAASGFSPTDRSRSPNGVLYSTYQISGDENEDGNRDHDGRLRQQMVLRKLRRRTGRKKKGAAQKTGNAQHQDVDGRAANDLVGFELDTTHRVDRGDKQSREHSGEQTDPRARVAHSEFRVGSVSNGRGSKRAGEHLPFERDVDDARALGKQSAKRGQHERRRQPDRRRDKESVKMSLIQLRPSDVRAGPAPLPTSHLKNASAATNRMMIPCNTCTMSFVTCSENPST